MKIVLTLCLMLAATFTCAAEVSAPAPSTPQVIKGQVLEVLAAGDFTYLRVKTKDGETWAAVPKAAIAQGAQVTVENAMAMKDFTSKSLKRTFPLVYLGNLAGAAPAAPHDDGGMVNPHTGAAVQKSADAPDVKVPKATGANAKTVAEIVTKSAALKDKPVAVRGRIVKYNPGIMGKNWIHLRDGSGSAKDDTNDILVTSVNPARPGDVITARGVVRIDKDFGAGYAYKVLIEDATVEKQ
jgi:hypothetical protein